MRSKRNEAEFLQAKSHIEELGVLEKTGKINLYFFDVSGISLIPCVPYAWQERGKYVKVVSLKSQCLKRIHKPTWVILDNALQHTSGAFTFKARIPTWEKRGLFVQYLPAYSPELNSIEILWRFIKYT
jgi:hypothetical protein